MTIQPNSTFPAFHTLPLGAIRPRGWLRAQLNHDLEHGFVSVLDTLTHHASRDLFKDRIESSAEQFAWWDSETRGNWLWGYTLMAFLADRPDSYSFFHGIAGRFKFSPTHEDVACCCNPNSTRLLPHYLSQMWMHLPDRAGIAAVLYGACVVQTEIDGTPIRIDENTDYPFADDVHFAITLERPLVFRLMLRKPTWATGATVTINGMAAQGTLSIDGDWLILDQEWHGGDQVGLTLTARPQTVAYPNGEVAIVRGALQYVLPIPARQRTLKTYEGSPLVDVELEPQDLAQAYQVFLVDPVQPDYGLQFQNSAAADLLQPWAHPPVRLAYAGGVLVPMGCAILRRAAFPFQPMPEVTS